MSSEQKIKAVRDKLSALRNAMDVLLAELETEPSVQPRKRQNRKSERVVRLVNGRIVKSDYTKKKTA